MPLIDRKGLEKPIRVECPGCSAGLRAPPRLAGKSVACPKCKGRVVIPSAASSEPEVGKTPPPPVPQPVQTASAAPSVSPRDPPQMAGRPPTSPASVRNAMIIAAAIIAAGGLIAVGMRPSTPLPSGPTATVPSGPTARSEADDLSPQQSLTANERAARWTGQLLQVANRKIESESNVRQLELDLNRYIAAKDALVREKDAKIQQMVEGTLNGAANAETLAGSFGRGLLGGAATRIVAEEYDKRIAEVTSGIGKLRKNLEGWQGELRRVTGLGVEYAGWPKYRDHCYPIVLAVRADGVAQSLDIKQGDIYLSYNGTSLAYVSGQELAAVRDEASRNNVSSVEVIFARGGKLIRHRIEGGKVLGVEVAIPIRK